MEQLELELMITDMTDPADVDGWSNDFNTHVGFLSGEVYEWAESSFPHRNDTSMYLKMYIG